MLPRGMFAWHESMACLQEKYAHIYRKLEHVIKQMHKPGQSLTLAPPHNQHSSLLHPLCTKPYVKKYIYNTKI